jgi:hypothetical protein
MEPAVYSMTVIFEKPYSQTKKSATAVIFFGGSVLFCSRLKFFELKIGAGKLACLTHATGCTVKNKVAKNVSFQLITEFLNVFFK